MPRRDADLSAFAQRVSGPTERTAAHAGLSVRALIVAAGACALLVGLALLLLPVSAVSETTSNKVACGTAVNSNVDEVARNGRVTALSDAMSGWASTPSTDAARCDDAIGTRRGWSWGLIGLGLVVGIGGYLVRRPGSTTADPGPA